MIYVKTHLVADKTSEKSGVFYPRAIFEELVKNDYSIPGAFDVDVSILGMENAAVIIKKKKEFTVSGFDLIDDVLYLKVDANTEIEDKIYDRDHVVKIIMYGKHEKKDNETCLTKILSIDAVSLLEEKK